jgi:CheY-like chemotaxis protein
MSTSTTATHEGAHRQSTSLRAKVLLAEDQFDMRTILASRLRKAGFDVSECRDGSELVMALSDYLEKVPPELASDQFDLIITDIRMPGISGLSVAEAMHDYAGFPPTILITGFGDEETHERAKEMGVVAVFDKPFDVEALIQKAREVTSS